MRNSRRKKQTESQYLPKMTYFIAISMASLFIIGAVLGTFSWAWGGVFKIIGWDVMGNYLINVGSLMAPQGILAWVFLFLLLLSTGIIIDFIRYCLFLLKKRIRNQH